MRRKKLLVILPALFCLVFLSSCQVNIHLGKGTKTSPEATQETGETGTESLAETSEASEETWEDTEVTEPSPEDSSERNRTETDKTAEESGKEKAEESTQANREEARSGLSVSEIMDKSAGTILSEDDLEGIDTEDLFTSETISDKVFDRMDGVSFGKDCTTKRKNLRYLRVLHRGFDGETHIGEIVCNKAIAGDLLSIFRELYAEDYPIEKILLVDEYGGDDELSMEDNNTSCFNFRPVAGTGHLSQHAYGRAIDINPLYNPYITSEGYAPANAGDYVDRSADNPYKIDKNDLCYRLFDEKGFTWGGSWNSVKDYQHFQKKE